MRLLLIAAHEEAHQNLERTLPLPEVAVEALHLLRGVVADFHQVVVADFHQAVGAADFHQVVGVDHSDL